MALTSLLSRAVEAPVTAGAGTARGLADLRSLALLPCPSGPQSGAPEPSTATRKLTGVPRAHLPHAPRADARFDDQLRVGVRETVILLAMERAVVAWFGWASLEGHK
ncbi:hypothetical protein GCM10010245_59000 [Streptomyces spectabilis]|nr:hypothetical protein GCM10010245_59000 [Streptomyces spectabilis]